VLSVLVTLLIGWNIYCLIDVNKLATEMKSAKETNLTMTHETLAKAFVSLMNQTSAYVEGRTEDERAYNAISNALLACKHFYLAGKVKESARVIELVAGFKHDCCQLSQHQVINIYQLIGQMNSVGIDTASVVDWMQTNQNNKNGK
jgi:hypothetical protein